MVSLVQVSGTTSEYERGLWKAGCCGGFVASANPSAAFFAFLLSLQEVDFQLIALQP